MDKQLVGINIIYAFRWVPMLVYFNLEFVCWCARSEYYTDNYKARKMLKNVKGFFLTKDDVKMIIHYNSNPYLGELSIYIELIIKYVRQHKGEMGEYANVLFRYYVKSIKYRLYAKNLNLTPEGLDLETRSAAHRSLPDNERWTQNIKDIEMLFLNFDSSVLSQKRKAELEFYIEKKERDEYRVKAYAALHC